MFELYDVLCKITFALQKKWDTRTTTNRAQ